MSSSPLCGVDESLRATRRVIKDNTSLVSVVTPTFNSRLYLEATLQSVLAQDYPWLEYWVVDGGSTDGTQGVLQRYADRVQWLSEPDQGMYDAVNKGWRRSQGAYVMYVNSDDLLCPSALTVLVSFSASHPEYDLVYGDYYRIDAQGNTLERYRAGPTDLHRLVNYGNNIFSGTMLIRRRALERWGMMDTRFRASADYEFCSRLAKHGALGYVPEPIAMFRLHPTQMTHTGWTLWQETLTISRQYGGASYSPLYARYLINRLVRFLPMTWVLGKSLVPIRKVFRRLLRLGE